MKISENIHLVEDSLNQTEVPPYFHLFNEAIIPQKGASYTGVYIVLGDNVTLIDTGLTETPKRKVFPYLRELGFKPNQISLIVLSHGHGDHYQGASAIKKISDAKIAIHELDASLIEVDMDGELFRRLHAIYPHTFKAVREKLPRLPKADILLKDGDTLDFGGKTFEVIHTPGHTDGSICLYQQQDRILFTGDSIGGQFLLIYGDPDAYKESIRRLMKMDIEMMLMAHAYPPAKDPVIIKSEKIKNFLKETLRTLNVCIEKTTELFEETKRPLTLEDVEKTLKVPTITAIRIIEKLMKDGKVEKIPPQPLYW